MSSQHASVGSSALDYDLIVIGAGPVGENVADYAAKQGLRAAIVESELVGGECSYWACMPSKALLRSGQALAAARRVDGAKQAVGEIDVEAVLRRRTAFTSNWRDDGQVAWLESAGIELLRGTGRLVAPGRVEVGEHIYSASAVALATGSVPTLPGIPGLAEAEPWDTRSATSAKSVPPKLAVLGGGVAGVELAFAYASLGSKVTVLARSGLLRQEEPFVGQLVADALVEVGAEVVVGVSPRRVDRLTANDAGRGVVRIEFDDDSTLEADELLVSTGRRANTDGLWLEAAGVDALEVDDTMLVKGTDWLYAVGDVNGRALLTHQGKYQARAAGEAIAARLRGRPLEDAPWGRHVATADHDAVPHVVFSDPEVASVGLTEARARERGLRIRAVEYDLGAVAGSALHADGYTGRAKLVVDEDRRVVIGATFVGQDVSELLHSATIAIVGEVPVDRLWHAVPSYPTISEVWLRLLETYFS